MSDAVNRIPAVLERIAAIVGAQAVLTDSAELEPYVVDWRRIYRGTTPAVIQPANAEQLSQVVKLCAETRTAIIPQGGNTGMCGAATPYPGGDALIVSLGRLNRIIDVDPLNNTITAQAGCILAHLQQAAEQIDRLFPLSLGAEGSCQIGGNLSTNAGGVNVLRYGNTRDLVLGLEVVLPDGRIWDGLRTLRKDNTGYDMKHWFIGAEGTLGIITAAVLKLYPRPAASAVAWAAVADPQAAVRLLALVRQSAGDRINAFELISRRCLELVMQHIPGTRDPLNAPHPWYVLTEIADSRSPEALRADLERVLETGLKDGLVRDVVLAENAAQSQALWRIRESIPEAARGDTGMVYRHDIAIGVSEVPDFIGEATPALTGRFAGIDIICFGHLGDGNLHFNAFVAGRNRSDAAAREARDITDFIYDIVHRYGGSFSAEHGIGQAKLLEMQRYKSPVELDLMRTLKHALDPAGIMNPGKVL